MRCVARATPGAAGLRWLRSAMVSRSRSLPRRDRSCASPALGKKPGAGKPHWQELRVCRERYQPVGRPVRYRDRGAERVDAQRAADVLAMLAPIVGDIREDIADLPRRPEGHCMISVGEYLAAPADLGVQVPGAGDLEALHPARQRRPVVGLDDQVQVACAESTCGRSGTAGSPTTCRSRSPSPVAHTRTRARSADAPPPGPLVASRARGAARPALAAGHGTRRPARPSAAGPRPRRRPPQVLNSNAACPLRHLIMIHIRSRAPTSTASMHRLLAPAVDNLIRQQ